MNGNDIASGILDLMFRGVIRILIVVALVAAVIGAGIGYALAQAPQAECAQFSRVIAGLRLKFKEAPFLRGVTPRGTMMILTFNPSTSTWTLVEVLPDMTACIRADGNGMEPVPFVADGNDT